VSSGGFGFEVNFGLSILFLAALVLILWGFQQRQVYEKRSEGRVKLLTGASMMGAFALMVVMSMVVAGSSDSDDDSSGTSIAASSSSEADLALDGATRYLRGIDQVRVSGTVRGVGVDVTFVEDEDAAGTLTTGRVKIRLLHVDGKTYIKPPDAFWDANTDPASMIRFIDGRWIQLDTADKRFAKFTSFADRDLFRKPLDGVRDYTLGPPKTIGGVECLAVKPSFGGVLYVAQSPARLVRMSDGKGFVVDLDYDAPALTPKAPSRVIDGKEVFPPDPAA
jgi:hypothetical protein